MDTVLDGSYNTFPDISGGPIEWKQIPDYPNYWVSTLGNVYNMKLKHLLTGWLRGEYKSVSLIKDGKIKIFSIHSLVARAFIPNPENKPIIDHINDRLDNRVSNLRWATYTENSYNMGKTKKNTSGYKGVSLHKSGKYVAHCNKKHIGMYTTALEAYEAYCNVARPLHGAFFHP